MVTIVTKISLHSHPDMTIAVDWVLKNNDLSLNLSIFTQVALSRYDGTPVIDDKPVMFEVSLSNVGTASYPMQPTSVLPVNGIASFRVLPEAETQRINVKVSPRSEQVNLFVTACTLKASVSEQVNLIITMCRLNASVSEQVNLFATMCRL